MPGLIGGFGRQECFCAIYSSYLLFISIFNNLFNSYCHSIPFYKKFSLLLSRIVSRIVKLTFTNSESLVKVLSEIKKERGFNTFTKSESNTKTFTKSESKSEFICKGSSLCNVEGSY
jgi:hypothetical protein